MDLLTKYQKEISFRARVSNEIGPYYKFLINFLLVLFVLSMLIVVFGRLSEWSVKYTTLFVSISIGSYLLALYIQKKQLLKLLKADDSLKSIVNKSIFGFDHQLFEKLSIDLLKDWMKKEGKGLKYIDFMIHSYESQNEKEHKELGYKVAFFAISAAWLSKSIVDDIYKYLKGIFEIDILIYLLLGFVLLLFIISCFIHGAKKMYLTFNRTYNDRELLLNYLSIIKEELIEG